MRVQCEFNASSMRGTRCVLYPMHVHRVTESFLTRDKGAVILMLMEFFAVICFKVRAHLFSVLLAM